MAAKTYRALANGYVDALYIYEGELFTTSAPKGSWMEEVEPDRPPAKPAKADA